jgi:hypothetical protein
VSGTLPTRPSSAGICSTCGKHAEKRYGGEGKYLPECGECWTRGWAEEMVVARAIEEAHYVD